MGRKIRRIIRHFRAPTGRHSPANRPVRLVPVAIKIPVRPTA